MRKQGLYIILLILVFAVPLMAQETTPEVTPDVTSEPTQETTPVATPATETETEATAEATAAPDGPRLPTAHIRIAHLSVDTPPVQIYINGELSDIQTIAYPDVTGWVEVPVGTYSIAVVPIDEDLEQAVLGPVDLSFARGSWVTIAAIGSLENGTLNAQLIAESYGQIPLSQARLTILHAIEGADPIDVVLNGNTIPVQGMGYTGAFIADVPAGEADVQIVASGTDDVVLDIGSRELNAGSFYFFGLTGTAGTPQVVIGEVATSQVANFLSSVDGTIIETLEADGRFTRLLDAIDAAGLTETLNSTGSYTLFAPIDAAFAAIPDDELDDLLSDSAMLSDLLLYHVVEGTVTSQDVFAASTLTTMQGSEVTVSLNDQGAYLNTNAQVIIVDVPATNGVIHAISGVLMPDSDAGGDGAADESDEMQVTPEATAESGS